MNTVTIRHSSQVDHNIEVTLRNKHIHIERKDEKSTLSTAQTLTVLHIVSVATFIYNIAFTYAHPSQQIHQSLF